MIVPVSSGLYDPQREHDSCGVGFVAHIKGVKTHSIIDQGLLILENLDHRGAVGADPLESDGAGILLQVPDAFLRAEARKTGITLPPVGDYGVGMVFLPKSDQGRQICQEWIEQYVAQEGQVLLGWRDVPVDGSGLGESVKEVEPVVRQVFIGRGPDIRDSDSFERKLFVFRMLVGNQGLD